MAQASMDFWPKESWNRLNAKGHSEILVAEVDRICSSTLFKKSPVLTRLINFLLDENLLGHGSVLKSYTVAVEGLGRPADFDPQIDSYPRVLVSRLRKVLGEYYNTLEVKSDLCLVIPVGSYALCMQPRSECYLEWEQGHSTVPVEVVSENEECAPAQPVAALGGSRFRVRWPLFVCLFAAAAIAFAAFWSLKRENAAPSLAPKSAILIVQSAGHNTEPASQALGQEINHQLVSRLGNGWLARVQTATSGLPVNESGHFYSLETWIGNLSGNERTVYVRLVDTRSSAEIWAKAFRVAEGPGAATDAVDSIEAQVAGVNGPLALAEAERLKTNWAPGYSCALKYFRFIASREVKMRAPLEQCLGQPSQEPRIEPVRQAMRAMLVLDIPSPSAGRKARVAAAQEAAAEAVNQYPDSYMANFALARLAFAQSDCALGAKQAKLTVAENRNDTVILAVLATQIRFCGLPDDQGLADRVYRFQKEGDTLARASNVLLAIATQRRDILEKLSYMAAPQSGENIAYMSICNTMLFAALDQHDRAVSSWNAYRQAIGAPGMSDDELLAQYFVADQSRERVRRFLQSKHILQ